MSNPYSSPNFSDDPQSHVTQGNWTLDTLRTNIKIVAVMLIVQGFLEVLLGLFLVGMAIFMIFLPAMQEELQANPFDDMQGGLMIASAMYVVMGVLLLSLAILRIVAGFRNYVLKSRVLGIVALGAGLVTVMTCYCAPTSIGLCIFGLIVYLNRDAPLVFRSKSDEHGIPER